MSTPLDPLSRSVLTASVAGASAIVPTFYGFVVKSAQQSGSAIPQMTPYQTLKRGLGAAPTVGAILGLQTYVQNKVVQYVNHFFGRNPDTLPSVELVAASSLFAGAVSSPLYAILNGQSLKPPQSPVESLKNLSVRQVAAITAREGGFLFGLAMAKPVSDVAKRHFGTSKNVDYASAFFSGMMGALFGHPADTALTRWQQKMTVDTVRTAFRGATVRTVTAGLFSVVYKLVKDKLS